MLLLRKHSHSNLRGSLYCRVYDTCECPKEDVEATQQVKAELTLAEAGQVPREVQKPPFGGGFGLGLI